jgi:hypothetical protein
MLPWRAALRAMGERSVLLRVLTPPYAAVGLGVLRALRVRPLAGEHDGAFELVVGYEGYEKL